MNFAESRVKSHQNHNLMEFIQIDQDLLSRYEKDYSDLIKCSGVLHHLVDINITLSEFYTVLKTNGEIRMMV
jgi:ubiquinone/menaquinone biosynthesis C-methylase UbiE